MSTDSRGRPALGALAARAALGLVLAVLLAEGLLRLVGAPAELPRPVHLVADHGRLGLDCYPTPPADTPVHDLRQGDPPGWSGPDLEPHREATPWCVVLGYGPGGLRDPGPVAGADVLVVGDSFTEGAGVPDGAPFPRRLDALLGPEVRVLNAGQRGLDLPELVDRAGALVAEARPGLVIYALVLNDFEQDPDHAALGDRVRQLATLPAPAGPGALGARIRGTARALELTRLTRRWYAGMAGPDNAGGWERTRADLARLRDLARSHDAGLVVAVLPILFRAGSADYPFQPIHDAVLRACDGLGIDAVDLRPALEGRSDRELHVHPLDPHPSATAHRLLAEAMAGTDPVAQWRANSEAREAGSTP